MEFGPLRDRVLTSETGAKSLPFVQEILKGGATTARDFAEAFDAQFIGQTSWAAYAALGASETPVATLLGDTTSELNRIADFYDVFDTLFAKRAYLPANLNTWYARLCLAWDLTGAKENDDDIRYPELRNAVKAAALLVLRWIPDDNDQIKVYPNLGANAELDAFINNVPSGEGWMKRWHEYLLMGDKCSLILSILDSRRVKYPVRTMASEEEEAQMFASQIPLDEFVLSELARVIVAEEIAESVVFPFAKQLYYEMMLLGNTARSADVDLFSVADKIPEDVTDLVKRFQTTRSDSRLFSDLLLESDDLYTLGSGPSSPMHTTANEEEPVLAGFEPSDRVFLQAVGLLYLMSVLDDKWTDMSTKLVQFGQILWDRIREYYIANIHEFMAADLSVASENLGSMGLAKEAVLGTLANYRMIAEKYLSFFLNYQNKYIRVVEETKKVLPASPKAPFAEQFKRILRRGKAELKIAAQYIDNAIRAGNALNTIDETKSDVENAVGLATAAVVLIEDKSAIDTSSKKNEEVSSALQTGILSVLNNAAEKVKNTQYQRLFGSIQDLRSAIDKGDDRSGVAKALANLDSEIERLNLEQAKVPTYHPWIISGQDRLLQRDFGRSAIELAAATTKMAAETAALVSVCASPAYQFHQEILLETTPTIPKDGHTISRYLPMGKDPLIYGLPAAEHEQMEAAMMCALAAADLQEAFGVDREQYKNVPLDIKQDILKQTNDKINGFMNCVRQFGPSSFYTGASVAIGQTEKTLTAKASVTEYDSPAFGDFTGPEWIRLEVAKEIAKYEEAHPGVKLTIPKVNPILLSGQIGGISFEPVYPLAGAKLFVGENPKQNEEYRNASRANMISSQAEMRRYANNANSAAVLLHSFYSGAILFLDKASVLKELYDPASIAEKLNAIMTYIKNNFRGNKFTVGGLDAQDILSDATRKLYQKKKSFYSEFFEGTADVTVAPMDVEFMTVVLDGKEYGPLGVPDDVVTLFPDDPLKTCPNVTKVAREKDLEKVVENSEIASTSEPQKALDDLRATKNILEQIRFYEDARPVEKVDARKTRERDAIARAAMPSAFVVGAQRFMGHARSFAQSYLTGLALAKAGFDLPNSTIEPLSWGAAIPYAAGATVSAAFARKSSWYVPVLSGAAAAAWSIGRGSIGSGAQFTAMAVDTLLYGMSEQAGKTIDAERNFDFILQLRDNYYDKLQRSIVTFVDNKDLGKLDPNIVDSVNAARIDANRIRTQTASVRRLYNAFQISHAQTEIFAKGTKFSARRFLEAMFGYSDDKPLFDATKEWLAKVISTGLLQNAIELFRMVTQAVSNYVVTNVDDRATFLAGVVAFIQFGFDVVATSNMPSIYTFMKGTERALTLTANIVIALLKGIAAAFVVTFTFISLRPAVLVGALKGYVSESPSALFSWDSILVSIRSAQYSDVVWYASGTWIGTWWAEWQTDIRALLDPDLWQNALVKLWDAIKKNSIEVLLNASMYTILRVFPSFLSSALSLLKPATFAVLGWYYNASEKHDSSGEILKALRYIGVANDIPMIAMIAPLQITEKQLRAILPNMNESRFKYFTNLMHLNVEYSYRRLRRARYQLDRAEITKDEFTRAFEVRELSLYQKKALYPAFTEVWASGLLTIDGFETLPLEILENVFNLVTRVEGKDMPAIVAGFNAPDDPLRKRAILGIESDHLTNGAAHTVYFDKSENQVFTAVMHALARIDELGESPVYDALLKGFANFTVTRQQIAAAFPEGGQNPAPIRQSVDPVDCIYQFYSLHEVGGKWNPYKSAYVNQSNVDIRPFLATTLFTNPFFKAVSALLIEKDGSKTPKFRLFTPENIVISLTATGDNDVARLLIESRKQAEFMILPRVLLLGLNRAKQTHRIDVNLQIATADIAPWIDKADRDNDFYFLKAVFLSNASALVQTGAERWLYVFNGSPFQTGTDIANILFEMQRYGHVPVAAVYIRYRAPDEIPSDIASQQQLVASRLQSYGVNIARITQATTRSLTRKTVVEPDDASIGIFNRGRTCFISAALQTLARVAASRDIFKGQMPELDKAFALLEGAASTEAKQVVELTPLVEMCGLTFDASQQTGDPGEFLISVFRTFPNIRVPTLLYTDMDARDVANDYYNKKEVRAVLDNPVFAHASVWRQVIRKCPETHVTFQMEPPLGPVWPLEIPSATRGDVRIHELFDFMRVPMFDPTAYVNCSACDRSTSYEKVVHFYRIPKLLILDLQDSSERMTDPPLDFGWKQARQTGVRLPYNVVIELEITLGLQTHHLQAIVMFKPAHYIAYVQTGGNWAEYNDSVVTQIADISATLASRVANNWSPKLMFYVSKNTEIIPCSVTLTGYIPEPLLPSPQTFFDARGAIDRDIRIAAMELQTVTEKLDMADLSPGEREKLQKRKEAIIESQKSRAQSRAAHNQAYDYFSKRLVAAKNNVKKATSKEDRDANGLLSDIFITETNLIDLMQTNPDFAEKALEAFYMATSTPSIATEKASRKRAPSPRDEVLFWAKRLPDAVVIAEVNPLPVAQETPIPGPASAGDLGSTVIARTEGNAVSRRRKRSEEGDDDNKKAPPAKQQKTNSGRKPSSVNPRKRGAEDADDGIQQRSRKSLRDLGGSAIKTLASAEATIAALRSMSLK